MSSENNSAVSFILVITIWLVTYGGILGSLESRTGIWRTSSCRSNAGMAAFFAFIPLSWAIAPFMTGFYEDGFKFTCSTKRDLLPHTK